MSNFSGWAPHIFMSCADSHDVGGDGNESILSMLAGGVEGSASHEKAGGDSLAGLSLRVMVE